MPRKSAAVEPAATAGVQRPASGAGKGTTRAVAKAPAKAAVKAPARVPVKRAVKAPAKPAAKGATKGATKAPARKTAPLDAADRSGVKSAVKAAAKAITGSVAANRGVRKAPASAPVTERATAAPARPALVRDSFTMPEQEYAVLTDVKQTCLRAGVDVKKSELLRIGVALLGQLDVATLQSVLAALPQLKTGRPPAQS